jgi:hypothetical protein
MIATMFELDLDFDGIKAARPVIAEGVTRAAMAAETEPPSLTQSLLPPVPPSSPAGASNCVCPPHEASAATIMIAKHKVMFVMPLVVMMPPWNN